MTLKRIMKYWLPSLLWMIFIFPAGNRVLSSPILYRVIVSLMEWLWPNITFEIIELCYTVVRKLLHIVEYGILAFLLFRSFRGSSQLRWKFQWALYASLIAMCYAILDEILQSFIPSRNGSLFDVLMDGIGVIFCLGIIYLINLKKQKAEKKPIFSVV